MTDTLIEKLKKRADAVENWVPGTQVVPLDEIIWEVGQLPRNIPLSNEADLARIIANKGLISIAHAWDILEAIKPYLRAPEREPSELTVKDKEDALALMELGLVGHMSIQYGADELALKALNALLSRFKIKRIEGQWT